MRFTAGYVIRGKDALVAHLRATGKEDDPHDLVGPLYWTSGEGGRTVWGPSDYLAAMKRLFLSYVAQLSDASDTLPGFALDVAAFDTWWTIEALGAPFETAEDLIEQLKRSRRRDLLEFVGAPLVAPGSLERQP